MNYTYLLIPAAFLVILGVLIWAATYNDRLKTRRREFIEQYHFPAVLRSKILFKHPDLSENQMFQVLQGLKQFFLVCLAANATRKKNSFGMPSKIVDDAWHEFILTSREYSQFCERAFGRYLHHTPAAAGEHDEKALLRTLHQIKTKSGGTAGWAMLGGIPLLFAIDRAMAVEGGYHYDADSMAELEKKREHWLQHSGEAGLELSGSHGDGGADGGGGCSGGCGGGCGGGGS